MSTLLQAWPCFQPMNLKCSYVATRSTYQTSTSWSLIESQLSSCIYIQVATDLACEIFSDLVYISVSHRLFYISCSPHHDRPLFFSVGVPWYVRLAAIYTFIVVHWLVTMLLCVFVILLNSSQESNFRFQFLRSYIIHVYMHILQQSFVYVYFHSALSTG